MAGKLWHRRGELRYDLERWQREIEAVAERRIAAPEDFRRDVALKVRGALHRFEELDGAEMLKEATNRLSTGESASSKLREEVQEIHQVAATLLGLPQRALAAERGQQPPEGARGGDVVQLADYARRLGLPPAA